MLYVLHGKVHNHLTFEQRMAGFGRRAEWKYPQGMKIVGEWWAASAPQLTAVFESDSYEPILAATAAWADFFELTVSPATTPEQGLAIGRKLMQSMK